MWSSLWNVHEKFGVETLVHGGATGADQLAQEWALQPDLDIRVIVYRAEWELYGRAAGPMRNARMIRESGCELLVAFPGGRGTASCLEAARRAGVQALVVRGPEA